MGRQRDPIEPRFPFVYWVYGRPISIRNEDNSRPAALGRWRKDVQLALASAVANATKDRGFKLFEDRVELRILWLSTDPADPIQPDVDNILKPLIDALNGTVIRDDINVHRILAEKADINVPPPTLLSIYADVQEDTAFSRLSEVTVIIVDKFNEEYQP